jgi:hypothetical protein
VATLPSQYAINYERILLAARLEADATLFLQRHLPMAWAKGYSATANRPTNMARCRFRTFEYICDLYSQLELAGEVAYNQTIEDRVVAAFGYAERANKARDTGGRRYCFDFSDLALESERDNGHFIAHCIGGGFDVNVFPQERRLNRGWSSQGKTFRQMENYCLRQPGTFCFSRPVYVDGSRVPRWLEFGLLKTDRTLWVEAFDN